jgi:putative flippase GtrA
MGRMRKALGLLRTKAERHKDTLLKFVLIGASALVLNLILLWVFTDLWKIYYVASGVLASQISIVWNFIWHDNWTWGKVRKEKGLVARFTAFEAIYVSSIIANTVLLYVFTEYFKQHYIVSMVLAVGMTFMYNYFMHSKVTFKTTA